MIAVVIATCEGSRMVN